MVGSRLSDQWWIILETWRWNLCSELRICNSPKKHFQNPLVYSSHVAYSASFTTMDLNWTLLKYSPRLKWSNTYELMWWSSLEWESAIYSNCVSFLTDSSISFQSKKYQPNRKRQTQNNHLIKKKSFYLIISTHSGKLILIENVIKPLLYLKIPLQRESYLKKNLMSNQYSKISIFP